MKLTKKQLEARRIRADIKKRMIHDFVRLGFTVEEAKVNIKRLLASK